MTPKTYRDEEEGFLFGTGLAAILLLGLVAVALVVAAAWLVALIRR